MGLVLGHGLDNVTGAAGIADTQTGHGVSLRYAVDEDGAALDGGAEGSDGVVLGIAVNQFFVNLVGDNVEVVLHGKVSQGLQLLLGPHAAIGVGGGVQYEGLGAGRNTAHKIFHLGQEALRFGTVEEYGTALRHAYHLGVANPAGLVDDDLVAGIEDRLEHIVQAVLGAVGYNDLVHFIAQAVVVEHAVGDGGAQFQRAGYGGVASLAAVQRILESVAHYLGGVKIGLAGSKADNVDALGAHGFGLGVHGQGSGRGNSAAALRDLGRHNGNPPEYIQKTFLTALC